MIRGLAVAVLVAVSAGCGDPPSKCGPPRAVVKSVVDGDTIVLADDTKVRYILVDAPESTKTPVDCFGTEAKNFNQEQVLGAQEVTLKYDEAQCQDRFGRTLAYVTLAESGVEMNTAMIRLGYGCVLHIPPAGDARAAEFKALEADAKAQGKGVWGSCSPVTCAD